MTAPLPKNIVPFFWHFLKEQKLIFGFALFFGLGWALDQLAWPYVLMLLIDKITTYAGGETSVWHYLALPITLGISLWIATQLFYRLTGFLLAYAIPKLEANVRLQMFDYIQKHSYRYFSEHFSGTISNKIVDMTQSFSQVVQLIITLFVPAVLALLLSTLFFTLINPFFGLILGGWLLVHTFICFYFSKFCDQYALIHSEARSDLNGKVVDALTNHINIRLFSTRPWETRYLAGFQEDEKEKHVESLIIIQKMEIYLGILGFVVPGVILNGYMLSIWWEGSLTSGEVVYLFNTTWNMMMMAWFAGLQLPLFFKEIGIAKQALTVIQAPNDIIDSPDAKELKVTSGTITFDKVSFHYGKQDNIFQNKSLTIKAGEKVGLVGYSGSGKTTFVHLILRYFNLASGSIFIDGQDISKVTLESLRKNIAMIPQDPTLFHRTIEQNIAYGKEGSTFEQVLAASKNAHVDEFVEKMPQKYNSLVGERGIKLSGGQRQRISIARAILKNAPILILDEATSALDSVTEKLIQEGLTHLMESKTCIVIAHRLSTLSDMDRILVFDKGVIIEEGTHNELIKMKGHYAHLWAMQAGGFLPTGIDLDEEDPEEEE